MMRTKFEGKGGISATVLAHSIAAASGIRFLSFEIEYPRFILAELNTHRMLSKNSSSSRAIPIKAMHDAIRSNTARPIHFGKNQPGMQAAEELDQASKESVIRVWDAARDSAIALSAVLSDIGAHKQIANRVTEPYQMMKTVLSGTEFANLKWLRHHSDAQPEFYELLDVMIDAENNSSPVELYPGEWHLPYVEAERNQFGALEYFSATREPISLFDAKKISASCCAQTSYRKNDDSLEKAQMVFARLIESQPCHSSPVEHQATPMKEHVVLGGADLYPERWEEGVTHMDRQRQLWSGNLKGWIQHRKLIPGEAVW